MAFFSALFGPKIKSQQPTNSLRVQSSLYGVAMPVGWGQGRVPANLVDYTDFKAIKQSQGGKGGVGGGKGQATSYVYSATVIGALCEGPINSVVQVWNNSTAQSLASLGMTAFLGAYSQSPWSYMTTAHPSTAENYRGTAYVAVQNLGLGASPVLPNFNYEVKFAICDAISGAPDADPRDVIADALTNAHYGVQYPSANLSTNTTYSNYCLANGLVVSPIVQSQTAIRDLIGGMLDGTNSDARMSSGVLEFVPYGDVDVTGNSHTYTAPSAPQYSLFDIDFLADSDTNPIKVSRVSPAIQFNLLQQSFTDRANAYNPGTVTVFDEAAINKYGRRPMPPLDTTFFCLTTAAQLSANLALGRKQTKNKYAFRIGRRFQRLDAMDIIALNHAGQGIVNQWVRIKEIDEEDDGTFSIQAEEILIGTANAPIYGSQVNTGYAADVNASPGNVNTPAIVCAPAQVSSSSPFEIWMVISGSNPVWAGCQVWVSSDNATYSLVETQHGPGNQGVLSSGLAVGTDPDNTHTLHVDLSESLGVLSSGTTADADAYHTLSIVDNELISYRTATLTGPNTYDLTYLRRGAYNTTIASHSTSAQFARLDGNIFSMPYSKDQIGNTIYFKFLSFNIWGQALQQLSDVSPYTFVISGPPGAPPVTGTGTGTNPQTSTDGTIVPGITVTWSPPTDPTVIAIEIQYRRVGSTDVQTIVVNDVTTGITVIAAGILPGTNMEFRQRFISADRVGPWSAWQAIVAPIGAPSNAYQSAVNYLRTVQGILDQFAEIQVSQIYNDTVVLPGLVDGVRAAVTEERTLRADSVSALAQLLLQVQATAGDATAQALFRATAVAGPGGVAARIALEVRAAMGESYEDAAIFLDALVGGGSQITLDADRILLNGVILSSGGVLTDMLAGNAATSFGKEDFSGVNSVANTAFHDLTTGGGVTLILQGGQLDIDLTLDIHNNDAGDHGYQIRILKDGVTYKSWPASGTESHNAQKTGYTAAPFYWHDQDTGSHTYKAQFACPDSNTNLTFEGTLRLTEIKR